MEAAARKMKARVLEREAATKKMKARALELEAATEKMKARALEMEAATEKMKATALEMQAASEKMKATALEMEAATENVKATAFEMEAATEKMKATVLDVEAATEKMKATAPEVEATAPEVEASTPEKGASTPEMEAAAPEMEAATSEKGAAAPEMEAATSEVEAATSEKGVATSEMEAATSEMEAGTSEMEAGTSEMEAGTFEMEAATPEMEAAIEKMKTIKSSVLDIEAAPKKLANIFTLSLNVILYIFSFMDTVDKIAFALSCERFRRFCVDDSLVFRKVDFSGSMISTTHRGVVNNFFRERQLTQHIRELNISNIRVLNWQMDDHLQFIKSICPQLEALHVLNCGVSLQTLHSILKEAPQLTSLSWSIWDFTSEDIEFLSKTIKSSEGICLKNIKHLHLEILRSLSHIQIAKYLVLSCCRDLEVLEVYIWHIDKEYFCQWNPPLADDQLIPGFHQPSVENKLQHLHSLVAVGVPALGVYCNETYRSKFLDFLISVLSRKSSSTKWKKFCILSTTIISSEQFSLLLRKVHQDDFQSLQAMAADKRYFTLDELKTLFARIGDSSVRRLQLHLSSYENSFDNLCRPISRVGGHSLKMLCLSGDSSVRLRAEQNIFIHNLFSKCSNITELDLHCYCFEKDICEPLSELKHLCKVQLMQCAICSKYGIGNEISKANLLTFVESCKNITYLDVRGCQGYHQHFSCLTDDDLLAVAKLRNLKSLTLCKISGISEWTFLKNISENCKFLTMLRITDEEHFSDSHLPILMESARFLKHLAIKVNAPVLGSEDFWNLLSHAKNLERLCIRTLYVKELLNIPVAVETFKSLPRLHALHLHSVEFVRIFIIK